MSIDTLGLEWAQKFHETYERLAPEFGYETRTDTRQFESESKNGQLMTAVCGALIPQAQSAAFAEGVAAEREACAVVCDQWAKTVEVYGSRSGGALLRQLAAAIRARSTP